MKFINIFFSSFILLVFIVLPVQAAPTFKTEALKQEAQKRDQKRLADLRQIQIALELFNMDNKSYPVGNKISLGTEKYSCLGSVGWQSAGCSDPYMISVPKDPKDSYYIYSKTATGYEVLAYGFEVAVEKEGLPIRMTNQGTENVNTGSLKITQDIQTEERQKLIDSHNSQRVSDLLQIQKGLNLYFKEKGVFPVGIKVLLGGDNSKCLNKNGFGKSGCVNSYLLSEIALDPLGKPYSYTNYDKDFLLEADYETLNSLEKVYVTAFSMFLSKDVAKEGIEKTMMLKRDYIRIERLRANQNFLVRYWSNKKSYPIAKDLKLGQTNAKCLDENGFAEICNGKDLFTPQIPEEIFPKNYFKYSSNGKTFTISASLEGQVGGLKGKISGTPAGIVISK